MAEISLLVDAALMLGTALVYSYVGLVTGRRHIGGDAQLALGLFSVWWYTLAGITLWGSVGRVLGYLGVTNLGLWVSLTHLVLVGLCVAFWALLYYLVYLFTGSRRWLLPISVLYGSLYIWLVYLVVRARPVGVDVTAHEVNVIYLHPVSSGLSGIMLGILFILPIIVGAIGYARLFFRVEEPTQRYRIGLVSFTIAGWFSSSLLAVLFGFNRSPTWSVISRVISLVSALVIFAAYRPPRWIRRRWHIMAVDEQNAE